MQFMTKVILLALFIVFVLTSCVRNNSCQDDYVGTFYVYMPHVSHKYKDLVKERDWDKVKLISRKNGSYSILTDDPILKQSEGTWETESNNLEGECIGYIKQRNLRRAVPVAPFYLTVFVSDTVKFTLPFRQEGY